MLWYKFIELNSFTFYFQRRVLVPALLILKIQPNTTGVRWCSITLTVLCAHQTPCSTRKSVLVYMTVIYVLKSLFPSLFSWISILPQYIAFNVVVVFTKFTLLFPQVTIRLLFYTGKYAPNCDKLIDFDFEEDFNSRSCNNWVHGTPIDGPEIIEYAACFGNGSYLQVGVYSLPVDD